MTDQPGTEIVKWYTRARKFPQLIGRTPDGAKLPGGPYTVTQAVAAGMILVVGLNTMRLWARFGLLGNLLTLAVVTWSAMWLIGRIPVGSRSPFSVVAGFTHAVSAPRTGRLGGSAVRIRRPRRLRHTIVVAVPSRATTHTSTSDLVAVPEGTGSALAPLSYTSTPVLRSTPALTSAHTSLPDLLDAAQVNSGARVPQAATEAPRPPSAPSRAPLTGVQLLLAADPHRAGRRPINDH